MKYFLLFFLQITFQFVYSQNRIIEFKNYPFKNLLVKIPRPTGYDYFNNSNLKRYKIEDLTLSNIIPIEVVNIEYLIPNDIIDHPTIHIYTYKLCEETDVTEDMFDKLKQMTKSNLMQVAGNKFVDTNFVKNEFANLTGFLVLKETKQLQSIMVIVNDPDGSKNKVTKIYNMVFLKNIVIMINFTQGKSNFKNIDLINTANDFFIDKFIAANI